MSPFPPVILVTAKALFHWRGNGLEDIRNLGYLPVEELWEWPATRFVRGRWLWLLHKAGIWLWRKSRWLAWVGRKESEAPRW